MLCIFHEPYIYPPQQPRGLFLRILLIAITAQRGQYLVQDGPGPDLNLNFASGKHIDEQLQPHPQNLLIGHSQMVALAHALKHHELDLRLG
jgi:hypothetical protein